MFPPTTERVNEHTSPEVNEKIADKTRSNVLRAAGMTRTELDERQQQLRREWDVERALEANASALVVIGSLLGLLKSRYFALLPLVVGAFLLQHALQGWCPPLSLIRRLAVRTTDEIARERAAIAVVSGDLHSSHDPAEALTMTKKIFVTGEE